MSVVHSISHSPSVPTICSDSCSLSKHFQFGEILTDAVGTPYAVAPVSDAVGFFLFAIRLSPHSIVVLTSYRKLFVVLTTKNRTYGVWEC